MSYKLKVDDRNYVHWDIYISSTLRIADVSLNPIQHKLFDQDMFNISGDNVCIEHSSVRQMVTIPGVLVLSNKKTYGRWKRDKLLYKCIPDDRRLPIFLIPHKLKVGFNKKLTNKYITFKFFKWDKKHPQGTIVQVIGTVDKLEHFYEYQLYCKSLYASIQNFTKDTMMALKRRSEQEYIDLIMQKNTIEDRRNLHIFTIDPSTSKDYDDGVGLRSIDDKTWCLSIYISNVSLWLDSMDLWSSFSQRIATIYLPDRRRPMLPTILSDALCSLQENRIRFALALDIIIQKDTYEISAKTYHNTCICVSKNYHYDSDKLLQDTDYIQLKNIVIQLNKKNKYVDHLKDSHDFIAYLMIMMNYLSAQKMCSYKTGIYRALTFRPMQSIDKTIPSPIRKFLQGWMSSGGKYVTFEDLEGHALLALDTYIHITSPIRRLIDLLNILNLQDKLGIYLYNEKSKKFHDDWTNALNYINRTMRSIRKVQNDCSLLDLCCKNIDMIKKIYSGFVFERIERNDGLYQYVVYLSELKMMNRITMRYKLENQTIHSFKIYMFMDEDRLKQKIRLEYIPATK